MKPLHLVSSDCKTMFSKGSLRRKMAKDKCCLKISSKEMYDGKQQPITFHKEGARSEICTEGLKST